MNTHGQIAIRQWLALPKEERAARIAAFRLADEALQANGDREETETYLNLNRRVNDLWPTVPWWIREPAPGPAAEAVIEFTTRHALQVATLARLAVSRKYRAAQRDSLDDYLQPSDDD